MCVFFFQAEDGIRDLVRSRGLGDVYKRQLLIGTAERQSVHPSGPETNEVENRSLRNDKKCSGNTDIYPGTCLLYTSDAADERSSVDLGGRRIIKKKKNKQT